MEDPRLARLRKDYESVRACLRLAPGSVHMLGIGGVGMAALAVQLAARGYGVSGCDAMSGSVAAWLERKGIRVVRGHDPSHLTGSERFIVRSAAVDETEPELLQARDLHLPVFVRGTVLPGLLEGRTSIAVGGAHGKTTTTAMITHALRALGSDPSFCIGGESDALGGVAGTGASDVLVVEADESDGTLALYEADYAVVTNVEMDHVDFFDSEDALRACFTAFASQTRRALVYCADDPGACDLAPRAPRSVAYGLGPGAALRGIDVEERARASACGVQLNGKRLGRLELPVPGRTNVLNALAAVAVALELGGEFEAIAAALRGFRSVRRRFDVVAEGRDRIVISDYAHHPTEIRALLRQVRGLGPGRVLAVFQPHRFTRTAALGAQFPSAFEGVDDLILVPVYAASEEPVPGGQIEDLQAHFAREGGGTTQVAHSLLEAWEQIRNKWRAGDVLLVVGAGDVEQIASWAARDIQSSAMDAT